MRNLLFFLFLFSAIMANAQTWDGSTSTNWNEPTNWNTNAVPISTGNVIIPGGLTNYPVLASNVTVNRIDMQTGSSMDVNGFTFTVNTTSGNFTYFTGATLSNSNVSTDIVLNINNGGSGYHTYFRGNTINDNIIFNLEGSNSFFEGNGGANKFNHNAAFNINGTGAFYTSNNSFSTFGGNLTINRTVAGPVELFTAGSSISGNLSYTNLTGDGGTSIGNASVSTVINGTLNINLNQTTPGSFTMIRVINKTNGGSVSVQNSRGFTVERDTLLLNSMTISGYRGAQFGYLIFNKITGNVSISDDETGGGGYHTYIRQNIITGNAGFTNKGSNNFYDADNVGGGNYYSGNVTMTATGTGNLYLGNGDTTVIGGNLSITRTGAGITDAFNSGGVIGGNFSFTNNVAGNSLFGTASKRTSVGGTVNISINNNASPADFRLVRLINLTNGGTINVQNSRGFTVERDTLLLKSMSISGYRGAQFGNLIFNQITGNVSISDDATSGSGYHTYIRQNVITGNASFTNNGSNNFYDADNPGGGNYYSGNVTIAATGTGNLYLSNGDTTFIGGNLTITRTGAGITDAFNSGGVIGGNFSFTNNVAGNSLFGTASKRTSVGGTVNISINNNASPADFRLVRFINQINGGTINVQNSRGFTVERDTLLLSSLSISGYRGSQFGNFNFNQITGNVSISDDAANGSGYHTYIRQNVITGNASFTNNGSNIFYDADNAGGGNKYIGNITYTRNASSINVGAGDTTEISGNLTISSASNITLTKIKFNGNTDGIIDQLGIQPITISQPVMEKTGSGKIILNDSVTVSNTMFFNGGIIVSSLENKLKFLDNATQSGAGTSSHVVGMVSKTGNDAFTFPTGSGTSYNPVSMTAPANTADVFTAHYIKKNPHLDGYDTSSRAASLLRISGCEYWDIKKQNGISNVSLTFNYADPCAGTAQYITDPAKVRIAHWNGSSWENLGNTGSSGTTIGTVTASTASVTNFSPFTFASVDLDANPLSGNVNQVPIITTSVGSQSHSPGTPIIIDAALIITDADNSNLISATISISGGFQTSEDVLSFTNQNGISGNYNTSTGLLTLSGTATIANYQIALRSVKYNNTSSNPNTTNRTISFQVNDGIANSNMANKIVTITVTPSVSISASPGNTICAGTNVTFTATPTNGGTPSYQWKLNGSNAGTNSNTYSNSALVNGDQVSVVMTSSLANASPQTATSNTITMAVTASVTPSVSISASPGNTICAGTQVTFTATPTNGGTPSYQWKLNGNNVGTNSATYQSTTLVNNDVVTVVMTSSLGCASPATATSNAIPINVTASVAPSVSISASATTICAGTQVTFTATPTNGGTPSYQWKLNGNNVGTNSATYQSATLANNDVVTVMMTSSLGCASPATAASNAIPISVTASVAPSVSISASATTICAGTQVTFTATPTNGGTPSYQWKLNGSNAGTNSNTYSNSSLVNGDQVSVVMTSSLGCASPASATSNNITMTVTASVAPSVSISASGSIICSGTNVTFTATPTNGGTPSYQWKLNGSNAGTNSNTYSNSSLVNGDQVSVVMTSSLGCASPASATSNNITMTVTASVAPSVSISASGSVICAGTNVTFTATPTNGGTPSYQWKLNGSNAGTNSNTYSNSALVNGDQVSVVMTSSLGCASPTSATSNNITMTVTASVAPSVSISASGNIICAGTNVTFTATPTNGGTPSYQWKLNGNNVGTNSATYQSATLVNNDVVTVEMTSSLGCASPATATSNAIPISVTASVAPSVSISASATTICASTQVTFTATPTNGGTPSYQWKLNGNNVGTNSATYQSTTLVNNDVVTVVMTSSLGCASPATATSNAIPINVTASVAPSVSISASATTICAGTQVTFTATPTNGGTPSYQWKLNGNNVGTNSATYQSATLANNDVVTVMMTSSLGCASPATAASNAIPISVTASVAPSVSISASATTICAGTQVTFTATPTNGGTPSYQWKLNGSNAGTNSNTYSNSSLVNGDQVSVVMTSSLGCASPASATSNNITMTVTASVAPSVSISASGSIICSGTNVTFTATPTNGGTPSYQWKLNGSNAGTNSNTYSNSSLVNGDQVSVVMTSSLGCASPASATSNNITMTVQPEEDCFTTDKFPKLLVHVNPVKEGDRGYTLLTVTVKVNKPSSQLINFDYHTVEGSATAGVDFVSASGKGVIPPGSVSTSIVIYIIGDLLKEKNEEFYLVFSNGVNVSIPAKAISTIMIIDDDKKPALPIKNNVDTQIPSKIIIPNVVSRNQIWKIPQLHNFTSHIEVFDMRGSLVFKKQNSNGNDILIKDFSPGIYFYRIIARDNLNHETIYSGKLMVIN